jgi:hypothetical protein
MTFFAPPPSCRWSLALELGHYPRLVELRGQSSRASTGCSALGQPAATQGNDWPCSHRGRWRQARDHQPIHRVTLRFETIAGSGEPRRPFRRQRVIARHSTKPTWTQSLLRLGWCRERVRVPQEVTDSAVIEAGAAKRLQRVKTVRELSVVGPCVTLGLVLRVVRAVHRGVVRLPSSPGGKQSYERAHEAVLAT